MRIAPKVTVADQQRQALERLARGRSTLVRLMHRARIVLRAAEGQQNKTIATEPGLDPGRVCRWRRRFAAHDLSGIEKDAPRSSRKATARSAIAARIIKMTTQERPPDATHWSTRTLASALGTNDSMVARLQRA